MGKVSFPHSDEVKSAQCKNCGRFPLRAAQRVPRVQRNQMISSCRKAAGALGGGRRKQ